MVKRAILAGFVLVVVAAAVWLFFQAAKIVPELKPELITVAKTDRLEVYRLAGDPAAYVVVRDGHRLLIDCPKHASPETVGAIDLVLLTHHHRDGIGGAKAFLDRGVRVAAPKAAAEWLTTANVAKFWKESIPLRNSRTAYFVHPTGFDAIDCTLADGQTIDWHGLAIDVIGTPGHCPDHVSFAIDGLGFIGDAVTGSGKVWTPFTTDWDHWQDAGLKASAASLCKLSDKRLTQLFPARGPFDRPTIDLDEAANRIEEVAFLKSYERYTNRLGDPPKYEQLVPKEQVGSGGDKPWSKVSDSLWITGNTYVLKSKEKESGLLVLDPWGQRSVDQIAKLREAEKLGPVEIVAFSHAHYDHFDGVYTLPELGKYKIWALDRVAEPLIDPFKLRAPFLDARPIRFDRTFRDGESATWREYEFRFHHLPGQTLFTAAIEATIDGKRCLFTADNFFHHTQYSGTGGWMGLNRSTPLGYANSARLVSKLKPEWILAEHGGPFAFDADDFERRAAWGEAAAKACDGICQTSNQYVDWNPHSIRVEPYFAKGKPGDSIPFTLPSPAIGACTIRLDGRGLIDDRTWTIAATKQDQTQRFVAKLPESMPKGRHIFALTVEKPGGEPCDGHFAIDVE